MEPHKLQIQLKNLNEVSKSLMQCQSLDEVVQKSLAEVRKQLNVQVASIFLLSKDGVIKRAGINGIDKNNNSIDNSWFSKEQYNPGESFSGKAVPPPDALSSYGEPHYSNNLLNDYECLTNTSIYLDKLGKLGSGISVPLNGLHTTFGTLEVLNKINYEEFSRDDVYLLMMIGTNVANLIWSFGTKNHLEIYKTMIEKLVFLESNSKKFDLKKYCDFVANQLISEFTFYKACIIRIADKNEDLGIEGKALTNDISWEGRVNNSVKAGNQIVGEVYETKKPIYIENIDSYEINRFNNKEWIEKYRMKSFACIPLSIEEKCVGTISVYTVYQHKFFGNHQMFLENIAFLTAAIVARARSISELRKVRKERNDMRERLLNTSLLVGFDTLAQKVLHQSKNEFINIYQTLEKVSSNTIKNKDKDYLVQDLMERIERRSKEIQIELKNDEIVSVDINEAIKEVIKNLSFEFSDVDIQIEEKLDNKIPIIAIDEKAVKDIIFNLLINAEKAIENTHKKKGKIIVTTNIDMDSIQYIQIIVEDNGNGIPNEIRSKIFKKGFTTRKEEGGTGLGLFTVYEILKSYGGKINFDSSVGKGTKFFVKIPLKRYLV